VAHPARIANPGLMDLNPVGIRGWSEGLQEFPEGKARNLGDDVINPRLEARGSQSKLQGEVTR
jgi:FKBP-type peptidyl-prolyl cis-trans isomerase